MCNFHKLFLYVFIAVCQRVYKDRATDVNIKEAVGDWLNQAKVRKIRRWLLFSI